MSDLEPQKVIFAHNGGSAELVARLAGKLREAFPNCDVMEIENPPPCVKCGTPAVVQVDGADLCGQCGEVKVESVVRVASGLHMGRISCDGFAKNLEAAGEKIRKFGRVVEIPDDAGTPAAMERSFEAMREAGRAYGIEQERRLMDSFSVPPEIIGEPEEPKYANRAARRHAEPGMRFEPATQSQVRGAAEPVRRNDVCPCGSGRKFKNCCRLEPVALDMLAAS